MSTKPTKKKTTRKKTTKKAAAKKATTKPKRKLTKKTQQKRARKAAEDSFGIVEEAVTDKVKFADRKRVSMYEPILERVRKLKPGRMLKIGIPVHLDPTDFRTYVSAAIRKRLDKKELLGKVRCRLIVDEQTNEPIAVAIVCKKVA